jgi:glycine/D-amino acid oxidase-like deaminating enzyme
MNNTKPKVVVVGAGITGLCTALALAKDGLPVTILERDAPPPTGGADQAFFEWNRRGAAQFRHPHAFLAVMSNLLQESFPGLRTCCRLRWQRTISLNPAMKRCGC